MLHILEGGLQTLVQDSGRKAYYHLGVPPSGAADRYSYFLGNALVGNPLDYAALEMTLLGPKMVIHKKTVIAITGAPIDAKLNHQPIPMWTAIAVEEGDLLTFGSTSAGVKTYLCVSGGIQVPEVLGCKSTYTLSKLGGYHGRKLKAGDEIPIGEPLPGVFHQIDRSIPKTYLPSFEKEVEIRVVLGISNYRISDEGLKSFLNQSWRVELESNNIAYRYKGGNVAFKPLDHPFGGGNRSSNVVDIVYPIGAVMVPNEEELIILLRDATTGGGFVTIGTVIQSDLDIIAQSPPKQETRFMSVTVEQAIEARMNKKKMVNEVIEMFR